MDALGDIRGFGNEELVRGSRDLAVRNRYKGDLAVRNRYKTTQLRLLSH